MAKTLLGPRSGTRRTERAEYRDGEDRDGEVRDGEDRDWEGVEICHRGTPHSFFIRAYMFAKCIFSGM